MDLWFVTLFTLVVAFEKTCSLLGVENKATVDHFAKNSLALRNSGDFGVWVEVCFSALLRPSFKEMAAFLPHELFVALEKVVDLVANLGNEEAILTLALEHSLAHLPGGEHV